MDFDAIGVDKGVDKGVDGRMQPNLVSVYAGLAIASFGLLFFVSHVYECREPSTAWRRRGVGHGVGG